MEATIQAGEYFLVECPHSGTPPLREGQKLPSLETPFALVQKIEGSKVFLGPLRAGEISLTLPCPGQNIDVKFYVQELPPEAAANRYRPLGAETVDYPLALFLWILGLTLLFLVGALLYFFRKRKDLPFVKTQKAMIPPRQRLETEISTLASLVPKPEAAHFHSLYKKIRRFLEAELQLQSRSHTTQEFLGLLRALGGQKSTNEQILGQIEYLLKSADELRFTGKEFSPDLWADYLKRCRSLLNAFPPDTTSATKSSQYEMPGGKK